MYEMDEIFGRFDGFAEAFAALGVFGIILVIAVAIAAYVYAGYILMCIGRKAGVPGDFGWMAYFPVTRDLYVLKIADKPWWYIFFYASTGYACAIVLGTLFSLLRLAAFGLVLTALFALFVAVVTLYISAQIYGHFGFNKLIVFCGFNPILNTLIAFSNRIAFDDGNERKEERGNGLIVGTSGLYVGQSFPIQNGTSVALGRDPEYCSIVFPEDNAQISRRHCVIRYYADSNTYGVTDYSKNGTYVNGTRLPENTEKEFTPGSIVSLGENGDSFVLR